MNRTAFLISDGTGITAEALGRSLLAQFSGIHFELVTLPYINTPRRAEETVARINRTAERDGTRPILFDTIVDKEIRAILAAANAFKVDIFATFLMPLEQELGVASSYSVGKSHAINDDREYKRRIDAVHFALHNDDGALPHQYGQADIILTGVSRCGKTPTCLYLAMQFGILAANYPLTEEDYGSGTLPPALLPYRNKLFGLTIEPEQLAAIRHERMAGSRYSTLRQCRHEVDEALGLFIGAGVPVLDATSLSVEEISTRIMEKAGLPRRL